MAKVGKIVGGEPFGSLDLYFGRLTALRDVPIYFRTSKTFHFPSLYVDFVSFKNNTYV